METWLELGRESCGIGGGVFMSIWAFAIAWIAVDFFRSSFPAYACSLLAAVVSTLGGALIGARTSCCVGAVSGLGADLFRAADALRRGRCGSIRSFTEACRASWIASATEREQSPGSAVDVVGESGMRERWSCNHWIPQTWIMR